MLLVSSLLLVISAGAACLAAGDNVSAAALVAVRDHCGNNAGRSTRLHCHCDLGAGSALCSTLCARRFELLCVGDVSKVPAQRVTANDTATKFEGR